MIEARPRSCVDPEGRGRGPTPLPPPRNITKLKGSLAILVRNPWKITKLPGQHSMFGHHRPACGSMIARIWCNLDPLSSPNKLKTNKTLSNWDPTDKVDPSMKVIYNNIIIR